MLVVVSVTSFPATVDCQWTCVDATMGEKERLTSSASASMGENDHLLTYCTVYYTRYPVYFTGNPVKYHIILNKPWAAPL